MNNITQLIEQISKKTNSKYSERVCKMITTALITESDYDIIVMWLSSVNKAIQNNPTTTHAEKTFQRK